VRIFSTFTDDLHAVRDWLKNCRVRTVAMESTSVDWIALFQILEAAGIEVCLVNARHCKNRPERKMDVSDCQWLQYLHSVGLLRASFRPPQHICAVRSLLRHRANLIRYASRHVQHLQKALTQMNLQIHTPELLWQPKAALHFADNFRAVKRRIRIWRGPLANLQSGIEIAVIAPCLTGRRHIAF
jgi:hypothetical protein